MEIFFCIIDYSIPVLMIISFPWWKKITEGEIGKYSGMRTSLSVKNRENWKKANLLCAKYCMVIGILLLIFVVLMRRIKMLPMEWNSLLISAVGVICMIGITIFVNGKLKK